VTELEELARIVIDCGYHLHKEIGPGLLETVYEVLLVQALQERNLSVVRQVPVPIRYKGIVVDNAFRADLVVDNRLIVELKSTEQFAPVHGKQLLTYLRLMGLPLGLLMNFGMYSFKDGIKRIVNDYYRPLQK
jgi:iron complex transport system substrate-binding protein